MGADAKDKLSHEHPSYDKLPMNLRHCTQPLNTHQLTTADAQHEAATGITRGIGMSPWWNVEANLVSARVCDNDVHISVRSCQKPRKNANCTQTESKKTASKHSHGNLQHDAKTGDDEDIATGSSPSA